MGALLALLLLALGASQSGSAAISGRVTDRATGRPVPRMIVTLLGPERTARVEVLSDADGKYAFDGLKPGRYALVAAHDEYRSTYLRQWFGESAPTDRWSPPPRMNIELQAGERRTGVDVALVAGRAIEGHVSDAWGEPASNAHVSIAYADGRPLNFQAAITDDNGAYRAFNLAPGRYRVCAQPGSGFAGERAASDDTKTVRTCYPSAIVESQAGDIVVGNDDVVGADIRLQRVGARSITGVVIDASGRAVDDAYVGAWSRDEGASAASSRTRGGGAFTLGTLAPGHYAIQASVGGPRNPGDVDPPAREREMGFASADLTATDAAGVHVVLSLPVKVSGSIVFDGGAAPRERAHQVYAASVDSVMMPFEESPQGRVNADGLFELSGVYHRPVVIRVLQLPDGWTVASVRYAGREIANLPVDLAAAPPDARLQITVTNAVTRPSVRVLDTTGEPVTSYFAVALPADPAKWRHGAVMPMTTASAAGVIRLGALLPGDYLLAAISNADWLTLSLDGSRIADLARVATKVTLARGDDRTIDLKLVALPEKR